MLIRKIAVENVRSFLDRQELTFDGRISIIIGPNGGGKTNLLDTVVTMLRRYLIATPYLEEVNYGDGVSRFQLQQNIGLNGLILEKHVRAHDKPQIVEITVEASESDLANMLLMKEDADELEKGKNVIYVENPWGPTKHWTIGDLKQGDHFTYSWRDGALVPPTDQRHLHFLQYLQLYEFDKQVRNELKKEVLQLPMIYLPVHRASSGFNSRVSLSGFSDRDQKRQLDAITSRSGASNVLNLAIGRLAKRYRRLELEDNMSVRDAFYDDPQLKALSATLTDLGYSWKLETINPDTNDYDVMLTKQGTEFVASSASSGERELLTYLFAIYALNVRDAVIVIDEPELHLHPRWQRTLFKLFEKLSLETGNQFVLATHSPTFISPASIQYVARIYIEDQKSRIVRLNSTHLPNARHLFNIVNSQNNERLFFCDRVVLVEGISDRIFFEKVFDRFGRATNRDVVEVINVGGKGFFAHYQKLLEACQIENMIIADLDYIEQIGSSAVKQLFKTNANEIKTDVIDNIKSMDAVALVDSIEKAIKSGDWRDSQDVWTYIKSRRVQRNKDLNENDRATLNSFIDNKRSVGTHILSLGALEAYLPDGHDHKSLEKLIIFLEQPNFWEALSEAAKNEIIGIARDALRLE